MFKKKYYFLTLIVKGMWCNALTREKPTTAFLKIMANLDDKAVLINWDTISELEYNVWSAKSDVKELV